MSVVEDALTAVSVGVRDKGVTSMHDATECGIWGGLYEIANASNAGMRIEKDKIIVIPEIKAICDKFGMDPYSSISEGTLLITCRPEKAQEVVDKLKKNKIDSSICGDVVKKSKGINVIEGGKEMILNHPRIDPFWAAFAREMGAK